MSAVIKTVFQGQTYMSLKKILRILINHYKIERKIGHRCEGVRFDFIN